MLGLARNLLPNLHCHQFLFVCVVILDPTLFTATKASKERRSGRHSRERGCYEEERGAAHYAATRTWV